MELALQIESLQEDQQGKLKGGFSTFSMEFSTNLGEPTNICGNAGSCANNNASCGQ